MRAISPPRGSSAPLGPSYCRLRRPVFPPGAFWTAAAQQVAVSRVLPDAQNHPCAVHLTPVTLGTQYLGAYATLLPADPDTRSGRVSAASQKGHAAKYRFCDICGTSPQITQTVELARKMARTESSVLITGESGTGKELFAHAIHSNSPRSEAPFVAINCAALPDSLLESELFGYEDGAFTGARKGGKAGLFELANTGSIFLDEIEGMAPSTQLKLLRVIQEREMMRVGGDRVIPIDVRIISASNQDLIPLMECGKFRSDLFYRVSTLPLNLPPLRQRKEDILPLIEEFKSSLHLTFVLTEEAKALLLRYGWPGNIRELRNCVEYMGCQNLPVIEPENLPFPLRSAASGPLLGTDAARLVQTELLRILSTGARGRKQLLQALSKTGLSVTEGQLRRELEQMKAQGYITSTTGRGGSSLTKAGLVELGKQAEIGSCLFQPVSFSPRCPSAPLIWRFSPKHCVGTVFAFVSLHQAIHFNLHTGGIFIMSSIDMNVVHFDTQAIHAGYRRDSDYGALATPIYQTSTFTFTSADHAMGVFSGQIPGYDYTRAGNPTVRVFEEKIAQLEGGEDAVATSSGMGRHQLRAAGAFAHGRSHRLRQHGLRLHGCGHAGDPALPRHHRHLCGYRAISPPWRPPFRKTPRPSILKPPPTPPCTSPISPPSRGSRPPTPASASLWTTPLLLRLSSAP